MDLSQAIPLIGVIILALGVTVFIADMRKHNRTVTQEIDAIRNDPQVVAGLAAAKVDAVAVQQWAQAEFSKVRAEFVALSGKDQMQVGQTAFDQWDAIGPFWVTDKQLNLDGRIIRTGTQPAVTFKSQAPTSGGNTPVTRES